MPGLKKGNKTNTPPSYSLRAKPFHPILKGDLYFFVFIQTATVGELLE